MKIKGRRNSRKMRMNKEKTMKIIRRKRRTVQN